MKNRTTRMSTVSGAGLKHRSTRMSTASSPGFMDDSDDRPKRVTTFGHMNTRNLATPHLLLVFEDRTPEILRRMGDRCGCCRHVLRALQFVSEKIAKSSIFSGITTILTIYALFGDDMRLLFTAKPEDWIFDSITFTCMSIFALEIFVCCLGKAGYMFGFFFWLDIMATVTIVLDVTVVSETLFGDSISNVATDSATSSGTGNNGGDSADAARAARMSRVGSKAGRVVRLIRLMRLIRLVKLYRKGNDRPHPGMDMDDDDDEESNVSESAVSRKLSEMTTRRVIMLVLVIMLSLPFFSPSMYTEELPSAAQYGINHLYRFWQLGMNRYMPLANETQRSLYMSSRERALYVDEFFMFIFYHNPFCDLAQVPSSALASPLDSFGTLFWIGAGSGSAWSSRSEALAETMLPQAGAPRTTAEWNARWGGEEWPFYSCELVPEATELLNQPWSQTDQCLAGTARGISLIKPREPYVTCPEKLRYQERSVTYPTQVTSSEWDEFFFMFVFDRRAGSRMEALLNTAQTLWICFLLGFGAMTFSNDANRYVLSPIERMIAKVDKIRNNPLAALAIVDDEQHKGTDQQAVMPPSKPVLERDNSNATIATSATGNTLATSATVAGRSNSLWRRCMARVRGCSLFKKSESPEPMETVVLEKTIIKIGSLLALGFGEAGAEIIGQNMKGESSSTLNAMVPGRRVDAIFGFCDIRNFMDTTEVLQDQVMVFVNQIAGVVHSCTNEYFGSPNKNIGNAFLLAWRLSGHPPQKQERLADMALVALVKIISQINKSPLLAEYRSHPKLLKRIPDYHVRMGFGLHSGWAIEGAIGSEFKIDASYLSPNVNMASRLEAATKLYGCLILASDALMRLLSELLREECRLIDHVRMEGTRKPFKLYTLDLDDMALAVQPTRRNDASRHAKWKRRFELQKRKGERWSDEFVMHDLFMKESDIVQMRQKFTMEFFCKFNMAYLNYEAGEWEVARSMLEVSRDSLGAEDGPSVALLRYMKRHGYATPKAWPGYRVLSDRAVF